MYDDPKLATKPSSECTYCPHRLSSWFSSGKLPVAELSSAEKKAKKKAKKAEKKVQDEAKKGLFILPPL